MKILEMIENEDGSATLRFDLTSEEVRLILDTTITKALTEFVENLDKSPISVEGVDNDDTDEAHLGNA